MTSFTILLVLAIGIASVHGGVNTQRDPSRTFASDKVELNLAYEYDSDFHVAFATIAFTSIVMSLALFAVSLGMWYMDPGRDSIIYRMTSTRMKKEQ